MNPPQVYMCSQSWSPLPPPYHNIPLGHPSALALSILYHASNLDWRFVSHMIIYVSMPFSQIIPLSPSPTESKRQFYTSVSLLLSCIQGYRYCLSKIHIYVLLYCIWRRKWQPTPVLLPGKSHGWRSLPGRLQSTASLRVRHDWATSLSLSTFMHWRRK